MRFTDEFLDDLKARLPVSAVVQRRYSLKKKGSEFVGISPFNPDEKTPSFTVNDQKGFYHCFSSNKHGNIFDFMMEDEGIDFPSAVERCADLAGMPLPKPSRPNHSKPSHVDGPDDGGPPDIESPPISAYEGDAGATGPAPEPKSDITKTYDYCAPNGDLLYQVCRLEWTEANGRKRKTFLQRRPSDDGGWIWGLAKGVYVKSRRGDWYQLTKEREKWQGAERASFSEVPHALYKILELREEADADGVVVLPEGEKDVETWREWGIPATTNSGGSGKWTDEHAEEFRGRRVVIPIDNDEAGRKRADRIGRSLRKHGAKSIEVIDFGQFWKDAPKGADTTDWKNAFPQETPQQLLTKVKPWVPAPFESKFGGYPLEDIDLPGPEHEYIIDGWMTVGDKSVIGGASKSGKSFFAVHAAWCIATGMEFFGNRVINPGLVIYQVGEGVRGIKKRLRAVRQQYGDPDQKVPFYILQSKIDLYEKPGDTPGLIEEIKAITDHYGIPLRAVFIDTLATASGGADENSGKDMAAVMANIDKIAQAVPGAHVCLVHHMNAGGTKLRGHTSIYANIDQVVLVTKEEDSKVKTAVLDKQKDDEDGTQIRFELLQVELGKRVIDGKPITSCITVPAGGSSTLTVKGRGPGRTLTLSPSQTLILDALKTAISEHGMITPPELRLPASIKYVTTAKAWKQAYMAVASDVSDNAVNQALKRASEKLQNLRIIGRINPYVWVTTRATQETPYPVEGNRDAATGVQEEFPETGEMDFSTR